MITTTSFNTSRFTMHLAVVLVGLTALLATSSVAFAVTFVPKSYIAPTVQGSEIVVPLSFTTGTDVTLRNVDIGGLVSAGIFYNKNEVTPTAFIDPKGKRYPIVRDNDKDDFTHAKVPTEAYDNTFVFWPALVRTGDIGNLANSVCEELVNAHPESFTDAFQYLDTYTHCVDVLIFYPTDFDKSPGFTTSGSTPFNIGSFIFEPQASSASFKSFAYFTLDNIHYNSADKEYTISTTPSERTAPAPTQRTPRPTPQPTPEPVAPSRTTQESESTPPVSQTQTPPPVDTTTRTNEPATTQPVTTVESPQRPVAVETPPVQSPAAETPPPSPVEQIAVEKVQNEENTPTADEDKGATEEPALESEGEKDQKISIFQRFWQWLIGLFK